MKPAEPKFRIVFRCPCGQCLKVAAVSHAVSMTEAMFVHIAYKRRGVFAEIAPSSRGLAKLHEETKGNMPLLVTVQAIWNPPPPPAGDQAAQVTVSPDKPSHVRDN
jgi:hypothetical protein